MIFRHAGPQSIRSLLVEGAFRRARINRVAPLEDNFLIREYNRRFLISSPPRSVLARCTAWSWMIGEHAVHVLVPHRTRPCRSIVYLHGGSYLFTFTRLHWNFLARLATESRSIIIAPDYPLAPKYSWAHAYRMLRNMWERIESEIPAASLTLMGDSAGGGLALGFCQMLRDEGRALPASLVMLSPWLDVTMDNPAIEIIEDKDPFLSVEGLRKAGLAWAHGANPRKPAISPLYGDMTNLPPMSLFIGTKDILLADCRRLRELCAVTGARLDYYEYENMVHVWVLMPVDESEHAFRQILGIIDTSTACTDSEVWRRWSARE